MDVTDTCRQARSVTPGMSSSRSPVAVSSAHSRSRTTSLPSWDGGPPMRGGEVRHAGVLTEGEQLSLGGFLGREPAFELVPAHVVGPALDQRHLDGPVQGRA